MSRSIALAHIVPGEDGTSCGIWGVFTLKSAFQPIFAFRDGKLVICAFEGLVRPFRNGEAVTPGDFFGSVPAPERLHVETLTRTLHLLNAGRFLDPAAQIFVNFDPSVYCDRAIADGALRDMRLGLSEAGIDPRRMVCEVTEQKAGSQQGLAGFVAALRAHGLRIAVDDYGAANSDMERVAALKPDIVKFDALWLARLMESRPGFALLAVMVREFSSRGIKTVFEGIEEGWQLEMAEEAGADMVQGFVLARPEIAPTRFSIFSQSVRPHGSGRATETAPVPAVSAERQALQRPRRAAPARIFGKRAG